MHSAQILSPRRHGVTEFLSFFSQCLCVSVVQRSVQPGFDHDKISGSNLKDRRLWHLINDNIALLKNRLQKNVEFLFAHAIGTALEAAHIHVADIVAFDNILRSDPIGRGV
jgi:hypothetical protein